MKNQSHKNISRHASASLLAAGAFVAGALTLRAIAQDAQPSLDELLNLPNKTTPAPEPGPQPPDRPFDEKLGEEVAQSAAREMFEAAVREMDDAALMLQQRQDPGIGTQRIQESILAKLEQVLKAARENSKSSQSQSKARQQSGQSKNAPSQQQGQQNQPQPGGQDPNRGQTAPGSVRDVAGQDEGAMRTAGQEWGNLPPRLRQELQQGTQEHFSPVYRNLTERYYQRLSQESGQ